MKLLLRFYFQAGVIRCTTKNTARNQDYEIALLYIYINKVGKYLNISANEFFDGFEKI